MNISIIIPAYNEAGCIANNVRQLYDYCKASKNINRFQIVVVDDGSTDRTSLEIAKVIPLGSITTLRYKENRGKGFAIKAGLLIARYKFKVILDADLSVLPTEIDKNWDTISAMLSNHNSFFIFGNRYQIKKQPSHRLFAGFIFRHYVNLMLNGYWHDTQCPFKILYNIEDELIEKLIIDGFAYDVDMIQTFYKAGVQMSTVDVAYYNNPKSSVTFKKVIRMAIDVMKVSLKYRAM